MENNEFKNKQEIRSLTVRKREGVVLFIKPLLKKLQVNIGDFLILRAENLNSGKTVVFPANVRSNYRVNVRRRIRLKLGLKFKETTPVKIQIVKKLESIRLKNKRICGAFNNLATILPSYVRVKKNVVRLNCYKLSSDRVILCYHNSKSSNPIVLHKAFRFDPFIVGLWRAEGGKYSMTRTGLQFTNSNPEVIWRWLCFIRSLGFSLSDPRMFYYIQYVSPEKDQKREGCLAEYWSNKVNLPVYRFGFIYKKGLGDKSEMSGTVHVRFNNSTLAFIVQYLFLKFESTFLLRKEYKKLAVSYVKGTLCDCGCLLRNGSLKEIRFSASCRGEAELYTKVLLKQFNIVSSVFPDKRSKCFYVRVGGWENLLRFSSYALFNAPSWKGHNTNANKFKRGMLNHLWSKVLLCFNYESADPDTVTSHLLESCPSQKHPFATLVRRITAFLLLNGFLVKRNKGISLSHKGVLAIQVLSQLRAFTPAA